MRTQLVRAQEVVEELRGELARAEAQRDRYEQVVDALALMIEGLEAELVALRHRFLWRDRSLNRA